MKINYSSIRAIFALVIGLVLVCVPDKSAEYMVLTIGILFLVPGVIALIGYFASKPANRKQSAIVSEGGKAIIVPALRFPIEAIGSILLGIWLILKPAFFADLLMMLLGVILILGGLQQILMLFAARKWKKVAFWFYIVPLLILFSGVYSFVSPNMARNTMFTLIGVTCLVYAISELFNWFMFIRHKPVSQFTAEGGSPSKEGDGEAL
jgi:membrane protein HdeD